MDLATDCNGIADTEQGKCAMKFAVSWSGLTCALQPALFWNTFSIRSAVHPGVAVPQREAKPATLLFDEHLSCAESEAGGH